MLVFVSEGDGACDLSHLPFSLNHPTHLSLLVTCLIVLDSIVKPWWLKGEREEEVMGLNPSY